MDTFGERINDLRKKHGWTLRRMALELGVSATYLSLIINNERRASIDLLCLIAEEFEVSLDFLIYGRAGFDKTGDIYEYLINNMESFTIEERMKMIEILSKTN